MSETDVRNALRDATYSAGGQRAWARAHGFSAAYVNDVLLGRRAPAENICAALGIKRIVTYSVMYQKTALRGRSLKG